MRSRLPAHCHSIPCPAGLGGWPWPEHSFNKQNLQWIYLAFMKIFQMNMFLNRYHESTLTNLISHTKQAPAMALAPLPAAPPKEKCVNRKLLEHGSLASLIDTTYDNIVIAVWPCRFRMLEVVRTALVIQFKHNPGNYGHRPPLALSQPNCWFWQHHPWQMKLLMVVPLEGYMDQWYWSGDVIVTFSEVPCFWMLQTVSTEECKLLRRSSLADP